MNLCRICATSLGPPCYRAEPPGLASNLVRLNVATEVYVCDACGFAQSPALPDLAGFYDGGYRISLASEEHDQLVTAADGQAVYRTEFQAQLIARLVNIPRGAKVLDYGGAKAATLRALKARRPDIVPCVSDVTQDYAGHWAGWIAPENQSTAGAPPEDWAARFDVVLANFVLEHVPSPVETLRDLKRLLKPQGRLFLTVPNAIANPADMIVADHLNHFAPGTLAGALNAAGFGVNLLDTDVFPAALVAVAGPDVRTDLHAYPDERVPARISAANWTAIRGNLAESARRSAGANAAIFGAGFYGSWIAGVIDGPVAVSCFLENNKHLQGAHHLGHPVFAPKDAPHDVEVVFAGLNPSRAKSIISAESALAGKAIVYLTA